ncbi:MAG TPA: SMP-30/gluconolactonase/LRE family protein [Pirellulales bacterium]|nr:SMP-30/gluconolactonase/LRE family protein [Pirellulales bacterium]
MRIAVSRSVLVWGLLGLSSAVAPLRADDPAPAAPPAGEVTQHQFADSKVFPGTVRDFWVYVPRQYDPSRPACLYVNQDGIQYNAPAVFDRLIHEKQMPVTIGVFVKWGRLAARDPAAGDRFDRAVEYDTPDDRYVTFLVDELLPVVERMSTADGRAIHLSHDGNDRSIAGASSGAVCAFTAAWQRPDQFHRVFSTIGTYVGLRGADRYPTLIRKTDPRPLRVFLQDGSTDQNIFAGDWWFANQMMERALVFAGYEVNHAWGEGGHNTDQGTAIFADAMRWLWKDWPAPVKLGLGSPEMQTALYPDEPWKLVADGFQSVAGLAANPSGEVVFSDAATGKDYRIDGAGKVAPTGERVAGISGQAFSDSGQLFSVGEKLDGVQAATKAGDTAKADPAIHGCRLVVCRDGSQYVTAPDSSEHASKVWYISPKGEKKVVETGLKYPTGITLSCDQSLLLVAEGRSHWIYSYQIGPGGALLNGQRFHYLHVPEPADNAAPGGLASDNGARLYVATNMGVQVCDQTGRVYFILPLPVGTPTDVCFGGEKFDTLFAAAGDRIFKRKLKVVGTPPFHDAVKPPPPRL